ncbi:hypothetical protein F0310_05260 (plasmid) [Borrelia sp. A-FGy1]|nr:hypothetical protein [Borrelia sp. A-FGy1]QMU99824.1 hypothetical protein F0310_05260 [Borrelia sp. A-FGy1]
MNRAKGLLENAKGKKEEIKDNISKSNLELFKINKAYEALQTKNNKLQVM